MTLQELQASAAEGPGPGAGGQPHCTAGRRRTASGSRSSTAPRKQITGAQVAVYTARRDGSGLRGPFVARDESLAVKPAFESRTTAADPDAAKAIYVADLPFAKGGKPGRHRRWRGSTAAWCARTPSRVRVDAEGRRAARLRRQGDPDPHPDAGVRRRRRRRRSTRATPPRPTCSRPTSPTCSARSRSCWCSPRRCCARAASAARSSTWSSRCESETKADVAFIHQEIYKDNKVEQGRDAAGRRLAPAVRAVDSSSSTSRARSRRGSREPSARTSCAPL